MSQDVTISIYKDASLVEVYSQSGSMTDPVYPGTSITWDGEVGQVRQIQLWARHDGTTTAGSVIVEVADIDGSDESAWSKLALSEAGLSTAVAGASLSLGDMDPGDSVSFWLRIEVPSDTDAQNKTDLRIRATASMSSSSSMSSKSSSNSSSCSSSGSESSSSSQSGSESSTSSSSSSQSSSSSSSQSSGSQSPSSSSSSQSSESVSSSSSSLSEQYVRRDGSTTLTGNWDIGNGQHILVDKIRARDGDGLLLHDDNSNGVFVDDGGNIHIGGQAPVALATLEGIMALRKASAPSNVANYGQVYVNTNSGRLHYQDEDGLEYSLGPRHFDVRDYGATGDGVTNDSSAINSAIAAMSAGDVLYIPTGHYMCDSGLSTVTQDIMIVGDGASSILDFSNASSIPWTINGSSGTTTTLTSDASKGDLTISVTDASSLSAGDYVRLYDDGDFHIAVTTRGEIRQIASIATNDVTFTEPIQDDYETAESATVALLTMLDVAIQGIKIIGRGVGDTSTWSGPVVQYARNLSIQHLTVEDGYTTAFTIRDVTGGHISHSHFGPAVQAGFGYGLQITQACQNIVMSQCEFKDCRHGISMGGTFCVQRNINISNNTSVYNSNYNGFLGGHATYDGLVLKGNNVWGNSLGYAQGMGLSVQSNWVYNTNSSYGGFLVADSGGEAVNIVGNIFISPGNRHGLRIRSGNVNVSGNAIVSDVNLGAIITNKNYSDVNIVGNHIFCTHATGEGIRVSTEDTTDASVEDIHIVGNYIYAYDAIQLHPEAADIFHVAINGSHCYGGGTGIQSSAPGSDYCENVVIKSNEFVDVEFGVNTGNIRLCTIDDNDIISTNVSVKIETEKALVRDNRILCSGTSGAIRASNDYSGLVARGNRIENTAVGSCVKLTTSSATADVEDVKFQNNELIINYQGFDSDPDSYDIETLIIQGNSFIGGSSTALIFNYDSTGIVKDLQCQHNTFTGNNAGMNTQKISGAQIQHNLFKDITGNALNLNTGANAGVDIFYNGNRFDNCGTDINNETTHESSIGFTVRSESFPNVNAADTNYVHVAVSGTGGLQTVTTNITDPDVPRTVTLTMTNNSSPSGDSDVTGIVRGKTLTETVTLSAGGTVETNNAFSTVTSYTIPAGVSGADTVAVGIGDKLGISGKIWTSGDVYKVTQAVQSGCYVELTGANQSVVAGTPTRIPYNSENYDLNSEWDTGTPQRFTVKHAGRHHIEANIRFQVNADRNELDIYVYKNGAAIQKSTHRASGANDQGLNISVTEWLDVDDYIEIYARNNTSNDNVEAGNGTWCCITRIDDVYEGITVPTVSATYNTIDMSTIVDGDSFILWHREPLNFHS